MPLGLDLDIKENTKFSIAFKFKPDLLKSASLFYGCRESGQVSWNAVFGDNNC